ncbi:MAG: lamin tail domain-containing protein [Bacteroidetes bacterium]|nr:lamin tail domain-containing protein [Bacteroidota bacterium]
MKKIITILMLIMLWAPFMLKSQSLAITEIMYNDPSTVHRLEFIELYNTTALPVDVTGYKFTTAITYTFPSMIIPANGFVIVAKSAATADTYFNISGTLQWDAGEVLSNTGESIVLKDSNNVTIDSVRYQILNPWPVAANGLGATLMKCSPLANPNVGSNWLGSSSTSATAYAAIAGTVVYATPLAGCNVPPPYSPVFVAVPFTETFDNVWANGDGFRDVPDNHWKNTPNTGNNSWRRNDDGVSASWSSANQGAYNPAGASGTTNSARFHSAGTPNGAQGSLDLYADFTTPGLKKVKFMYINNNGVDSLSLYVSFDAGTTFNFLTRFFTTTGGWNEKTVYIGTSTSSTTIIRFRGTLNGQTDIGLDQVSIELVTGDDAGMAAINKPNNIIFDPQDSIKVTLQNFGGNDLISAQLSYSVNNGAPVQSAWNGSLTPLGTAANINLGGYLFPTTGQSTVKAWCSSPNGIADPNPLNDTLVKTVIYQQRTPIPYTEHFDSIWINRQSTRDIPSVYWLSSPFTGNASWRRNDDGTAGGWTNNNGAYTVPGALGTIHSARFHSAGNSSGTQGTISLFLDFSSPGAKELRFYYINTTQNDSLAVWASYDGGLTYQFLSKFTTTPLGWELKTVNLGNSTSPFVVIRFRATASNNGNTDIGIDEVTIESPLPDVGVVKITNPVSGCSLTATENVTVKLKNIGNLAVSNIPVSYKLGGNIVTETANVSLAPGDTISYTFAAQGDFSVQGSHSIMAYTSYPGDIIGTNDTIKTTVFNIHQITTFPFHENFETGTASYFSLSNGSNAGINVNSGIGVSNSFALHMTGNLAGTWPNSSGNSTSAQQAWEVYTDHQAFAASCMVDVSSLTEPVLMLDLRQTYVNQGGPLYSWFRILINDSIELPNSNNVVNFNPVSQQGDQYNTQMFPLSAYIGAPIKITLQSSCKYNDAYSTGGVGDNVYVDNFTIMNKPTVDVNMMSLETVSTACGLGSQVAVNIKIKNMGDMTVKNIPVSYSIDNGVTWFTDTIPDSIQKMMIVSHQFAQLADFSTVGTYHVIAVVNLTGDPNPYNDTLTKLVYNVPYVSPIGTFVTDFENGPDGWTSGAVVGINNWVMGTPAKPHLNAAHSGTTCWTTGLTQDYSSNSNSYVLSPCYNLTFYFHPYISLWLNMHTEANLDAMIMEVSVNDSSWYKINTTSGFYNNTSNQGSLAPPKWSGVTAGWQQFTTAIQSLAGKPQVQFRFRFVTNDATTDEGISIDDITIFEPYPDMTVTDISGPVSGCSLSNQEYVSAVFKNVGLTFGTQIPVSYKINQGAWVNDVITDTIPVNGSSSYTFSQPADLTTPGLNEITVKASFPGDANTTNDSLVKTIFNTVPSNAFSVNFETANYFDHLGPASAANSHFFVLPDIGNLNTTGVQMTGGNAASWPEDTNVSSTQAWTYADHIATLYTCEINNSFPEAGLYLDLRQTFSENQRYCWFRVMVNDSIQIPDLYGAYDFIPATAGNDPFVSRIFYLGPYGPNVHVSMQALCRVDQANSVTSTADNVFLDNISVAPWVSIPVIRNNGTVIYPNPANDMIMIMLPELANQLQIDILNIQGQVVSSRQRNGTQQNRLDISKLPEGVYMIRLISDHEIQTMKFIKTK